MKPKINLGCLQKLSRIAPLKEIFSNTKSRVGLDIGSSSIKVVELCNAPNGLQLANFAFAKTPAGEAVESIKAVMKEARITTNKVNISISGPSVVVRYIQLPRMKQEELKSAIQFEGEKYIPFDIKEVNLDCQILGGDEKKTKMDVLLVAAKRDFIEGLIKTIREAGLEPGIIDLDALALINAFTESHTSLDKTEISALLHIGAKITSINILRGSIPCFTRDILIAGDELTKAISERLSMDFPSAENLKCNPGERLKEIYGVIEAVTDNLISEIRLSFDYYESQFEKGIGRIYLSGGGSKLQGLDKFLSESLGVEVSAWDPTSGLKISPRIKKDELSNISGQLAVALGLAFRR